MNKRWNSRETSMKRKCVFTSNRILFHWLLLFESIWMRESDKFFLGKCDSRNNCINDVGSALFALVHSLVHQYWIRLKPFASSIESPFRDSSEEYIVPPSPSKSIKVLDYAFNEASNFAAFASSNVRSSLAVCVSHLCILLEEENLLHIPQAESSHS